MGRLVERVEGEAAGRGIDGGRDVAAAFGDVGKPVQHGGDAALGRDRPGGTPVVELRAVAEREAREERAAGEVGRRREDARVVRGRGMLDGDEVDVDRVVEGDDGSVDPQPSVAQGGSQHGQRPPERAAGRLVVGVGPEEGGELVARVWAALDREDGEDRERLARVDHDRRAVDRHDERPEHADPEPGARAGRCGHPRNGSATDRDPVTFAARHPPADVRRRGGRAPLPPSAPP